MASEMPSAGVEGSQGDNADASLSSLGKKAADCFKAHDCESCLRILKDLQEKKEDDPKILHNIAVAEYYIGGCTEPKKLLDALAAVKAKSEELARAAEEQLDGLSMASPSLGSPTAEPSSSPKAAVAYMEDYDTSVPTLNKAVILMQLHQYAESAATLEPLFKNIEPLDEAAALRVCMLLLDIHLASQDLDKAAAVLGYVEKAFSYLLSDNPADSAPSSKPLLSLKSELENSQTSPTGEGSELSRTISEENLDDELKDAFSSLQLPSSGGTSKDSSRQRPDKPPPAIASDLKLQLHLYRARLLMLTRNLKATKREVKSALNITKDHPEALLLKAQLEFLRNNHRKAVKLLTTANAKTDPFLGSSFLSNLASIHQRLGKHHTAALYYSKALKQAQTASAKKPLPVPDFAKNKKMEILYNAGLQQLLSGDPVLGAKCFQEAASVLFHRPLLWLRIAECCISNFQSKSQKGRPSCPINIIGEGKYRRVVLPAGSQNSSAIEKLDLEIAEEESNGKSKDSGEKQKQEELSLEYAQQCLRVALYLLDSTPVATQAPQTSATAEIEPSTGDKSSVRPSDEAKTSSSTLTSSTLAAYKDDCRQEQNNLKETALVNLAYVELILANPTEALQATERLLNLSHCSPSNRTLGHMYAAEALCVLNRAAEAGDHLSSAIAQQQQAQSNKVSSPEQEAPEALTLPDTKAGLYVNLAAVSAMQGDLGQAQRFALQALNVSPNNPSAMLAVVYVELSRGRTEDALRMLKHCRHVVVTSTPQRGA